MSIVSWRHGLAKYKLMVVSDVKTSAGSGCAREILLRKTNGRQINANYFISSYKHNPSVNLMPVKRL